MFKGQFKILSGSAHDRKTKKRRAKKFHDQLKKLDKDAQDTILRVQECTMLMPNTLFSLIEAARYVHRYGIPGAVVECGVWRGGAMMAAALTFKQLGVTDRSFYLYDTFTGMPKPTEKDKSLCGKTDPDEQFRLTSTGPDSSDWCCAGLEDVKRNLASVDYGQERFVTVKGKVEETIPGTIPEEIAVLRLDTDWYESTKHEMEHLFPRLVPKGVLIIDDYFCWSGSQQAVDEYLAAAKIPIYLTKVNSSAVGVRP